MSERQTDKRKTDDSTGGTDTSRTDGRGGPERDKDEFEAGTGYQPSTNQTRDEPLPASHHDDGRQEAARRRGEPVRDNPWPRGQDDKKG
jgi:hypothetical protein